MDLSSLPIKDLCSLTALPFKALQFEKAGFFRIRRVYGSYGLLLLYTMILTSLFLTATTTVIAQGISKPYQHWSDVVPGEWNNNILNDSKSNYFEGEVIPHVYAIQGKSATPLVSGQDYTFTIIYNRYQDNGNAGGFGYITTYNLSRSPGVFTEGAGVIPLVDPTVTSGNQGLFYTVNADIISASAPVRSSSTGTFDHSVTVTFRYTGTNPLGVVEIYFGLYVAEPGDVEEQGKGPTKGASNWTGGSLQTTITSSFSGATSVQLAPAGIIRGEISGVKYNDANKSGNRQTGEVPLEGWTFYLDLNNNGVLDDGEPTDVTGADGIFFFSITPDANKSTPLVNDPYYVRELQNQTDWTLTEPVSGVYGPILITITDPNETGLLFGNFTCVSPTANAVPAAALCFGGTGSATVTASGGTAPYTYSLSGATDADGIFSGLTAASYTFRVTDANGCFDDVTVVIGQPAAALLASGVPTNASCSDATGTATISASGGTAPYTYSQNGTLDADGIFTGLG
ncbi:MAG TPA: SprB repeat-containing protein, partial [Daejeonella sp.]|nr:SprB repeat-containing protein [Daejeonella sp.]